MHTAILNGDQKLNHKIGVVSRQSQPGSRVDARFSFDAFRRYAHNVRESRVNQNATSHAFQNSIALK